MPSLKRVAILTESCLALYRSIPAGKRGRRPRLGDRGEQCWRPREPHDLERAFDNDCLDEHAEALMVLADPTFITHRRRIVEIGG